MAQLVGSKSVYKAIKKIVEQNGLDLNEPGSYCKIKSEGYMDLSVEVIASNQISICHYYTSNEYYGDLMRDPEMVFFMNEYNETAYVTYYRQDGLPFHCEQFIATVEAGRIVRFVPKWQRSANSFAVQWMRNLKEQDFIK